MEIGNRLRDLRKQLGLTQKELATRVNVSPQVVSNWEREYSFPDYDDVVALSKVFNVSTDYILVRTDDPNATVENVLSELPKDIREGLLENIPSEDLSFSYINGYLSGTILSRYEICCIFSPTKEHILKLQKRLLATALISEVSEETQLLESFQGNEEFKKTLEREHNLEFKVKLFNVLNDYFLTLGNISGDEETISFQVNIDDEKYNKLIEAQIISPDQKEMTAEKLMEIGIFLAGYNESINQNAYAKGIEDAPVYLRFLHDAKKIINETPPGELDVSMMMNAILLAHTALELRLNDVLLKVILKSMGTEEEWALEYLNKLSLNEKLKEQLFLYFNYDITSETFYPDLMEYIALRNKIAHGLSINFSEIRGGRSKAGGVLATIETAINAINEHAKQKGIE
jgi:transcriptional regulator with XRE-family HTH domain